MLAIQTGLSKPALQTETDINIIWRLAQFAHKSSLTKTKTPEDAFFIMQYGLELGIKPMTAIRTIYIVNGVPTCSGEAMLSLIRRSGYAKKIEITGDEKAATVTMYRVFDDGHEEIHTATFTIQDAARAQLTGKGVWQQYPSKMLKWRAISECAKFLFSDVLGGLYTTEEIAPASQFNEAGELIGEIIVESKPDNKPQSEPAASNVIEGQFTESAHWSDTPKHVKQIIKWGIDEGAIEPSGSDITDQQELLSFLGVQSFTAFDTGKEAYARIKELVARLKADSPTDEKPPAPAAPDPEPPVDFLPPNKVNEVWDWVLANFDMKADAAAAKLSDPDLARFSSVDAAKHYVAGIAAEQQWPFLTRMATYQGKYIAFTSPFVGQEMRWYKGRTKLAEAAGADWASGANPAKWEDDSLQTFGELLVEWEQKEGYRLAKDVLAKIPF